MWYILWFQVADVSVEVATVDASLHKLCRRYNRRRRRAKKPKKTNPLWNLQNLAILITVVVFVVVVIMWSLLWVFICKQNIHAYRCIYINKMNWQCTISMCLYRSPERKQQWRVFRWHVPCCQCGVYTRVPTCWLERVFINGKPHTTCGKWSR